LEDLDVGAKILEWVLDKCGLDVSGSRYGPVACLVNTAMNLGVP